MLGLLLVLPFRGLKPSTIKKWQKQCQKFWNSTGSANDIELQLAYRENVLAAFECSVSIYSNHDAV